MGRPTSAALSGRRSGVSSKRVTGTWCGRLCPKGTRTGITSGCAFPATRGCALISSWLQSRSRSGSLTPSSTGTSARAKARAITCRWSSKSAEQPAGTSLEVKPDAPAVDLVHLHVHVVNGPEDLGRDHLVGCGVMHEPAVLHGDY